MHIKPFQKYQGLCNIAQDARESIDQKVSENRCNGVNVESIAPKRKILSDVSPKGLECPLHSSENPYPRYEFFAKMKVYQMVVYHMLFNAACS